MFKKGNKRSSLNKLLLSPRVINLDALEPRTAKGPLPDIIKFLTEKKGPLTRERKSQIPTSKVLDSKEGLFTYWNKLPRLRQAAKLSPSLPQLEPFHPVPKRSTLPSNTSVIEIYSIGFSHLRATGYGNASGYGIMITKSIVLTIHDIIPDEDTANKAYAVFGSNPGITHKFNPQSFFYTNKGLNFTILAFSVSARFKSTVVPIEIREKFELREGFYINYLQSGIVPKSVVGVEVNQFSFTGGDFILPGAPVFTEE